MQYLYLVAARVLGGVRGYAVLRSGKAAPGISNAVIINSIRTAICLAVSLAVWLLSGASVSGPRGIAIILLSGVSQALYLLFWILSASAVSVGLLEVFMMIGTVVIPLMLSPVLFSGDAVSLPQWIGVGLILFATVFMSAGEQNSKGKVTPKSAVYITLAVLAALGSALSQKLYTFFCTASGDDISYYNLGTFAVAAVVFAAALAVIELRARGIRKKPSPIAVFPLRSVIVYIVFASLALYLYQFLITLASTLPSGIYYPLSYALGFTVSICLDTFFLGIKMNAKRIVGIAAVAASIALVC